MSAADDELYFRREQSQIKHAVVEKYLERFAIIVGKWKEGIVYVDGFSGPWNSVSNDFKDSSFAIALKQLRSAREAVRNTFGKELGIRCIFLEKDPEAFRQLDAFAKEQTDVEVLALNRGFEEAVPDLVRAIDSQRRGYFPFILIDPTGWKGFSMDVIAPLIRIQPCEVLINFMTSFIHRFIADEREGLEASFRKLFGDDSYKSRIDGLEGRERENALVAAYADRISAVGRFPFVPYTFVLKPVTDTTHFHLVYATRHLRGVEVFKEAERKALELSEVIRADAKRRARESHSGQTEFFGGTELPERMFLAELHDYYEGKATQAVAALFGAGGSVGYDDLYAAALRYPTVQESFLKKWLSTHADFLEAGESKSPKIGRNHRFSALLRLRDGNIPGAIDDLASIDQLSEVVGGASSLVRHVLRVGFWTFGVRGMLWEILQNPDTTDADFVRMEELVSNCDFLTNALKAIEIEIAVQDAAYRYLRTAPESGMMFWTSDSGSILDSEPAVAVRDFLWPSIWAAGDEARSLEWWSDGYKKGRELLASRNWTSIRASLDDGESSVYDLWRFPFAENTSRSNAVRSFLRAVVRAEVSRELLLAAIALERYQRRSGDYPEELQLLVPDFLKDLPHDWFDGRPLKYRRLDPKNFLLYSVGQDGTDDGGDASPAKSNAPPSFDSGKDLLWPVRGESSSDLR